MSDAETDIKARFGEMQEQLEKQVKLIGEQDQIIKNLNESDKTQMQLIGEQNQMIKNLNESDKTQNQQIGVFTDCVKRLLWVLLVNLFSVVSDIIAYTESAGLSGMQQTIGRTQTTGARIGHIYVQSFHDRKARAIFHRLFMGQSAAHQNYRLASEHSD
jgi:hypothetical protein